MAKKLNFHGEMKETVIRKVSNFVFNVSRRERDIKMLFPYLIFSLHETTRFSTIFHSRIKNIREAKIRSSRIIEFHLKIILLIRPILLLNAIPA